MSQWPKINAYIYIYQFFYFSFHYFTTEILGRRTEKLQNIQIRLFASIKQQLNCSIAF